MENKKDQTEDDIPAFRGLSFGTVKKNKKTSESEILASISGLAKIYTEGFDEDGELEHNMPCPICIKNKAKYEQIGQRFVFGPCLDCGSNGYYISKKWWS